MLKATCTKDSTHLMFRTTTHVMEEWVVDEKGNFLDRVNHGFQWQVIHEPDPGNLWSCAVCGAEAKVEVLDNPPPSA